MFRVDSRALVGEKASPSLSASFSRSSVADTTVFPSYTDQTVEAYEGRGIKVTYKKYEGATHTNVPDAARKDTTYFVDKVLG